MFWKILYGTLTVMSIGRLVSSNSGTKNCCSDGLGLNYTLPMFIECKKKQVNGHTVQTIPKLIHGFSAGGDCLARKSKLGIPPGQRVCRFPDCERNPCKNGWCEETMDSWICHSSSGCQEKYCNKQNRKHEPNLNLNVTSKLVVTPACQLDLKGVNYAENLSRTVSGKICQQWSSDYPHKQVYNFIGAHNYCRNPDNSYTAWCYTIDRSKRWEYCAVGVLDPECTITPVGDSECFTRADARDYRGNVSVTQNGHPCQKWTSQTPYSHQYTPSAYPDDGLGDHNHCRNPGIDQKFAYCIGSFSPRIEYCNIGLPQESCNNVSTTGKATNAPTTTQKLP